MTASLCAMAAALLLVATCAGALQLPPVSTELTSALNQPSGADVDWSNTFRTLAASPAFASTIWEQRPLHVANAGPKGRSVSVKLHSGKVKAACKAGLLEHTGANIFTLAGGRTFSSPPDTRALKAQGAAIRPRELKRRLAQGSTLSLNRAGAVFPAAAVLVAAAARAFRLPTVANAYMTRAGVPSALPPHNDRQSVLIVQLEGRKVWRTWPAAVANPLQEQIRGKGRDELDRAALGEPSMTVTLSAGDLLYVPRGYIHATATPASDEGGGGGGGAAAHSLHLTIGLETETVLGTWNRAVLCAAALASNDGGEKVQGALHVVHAAIVMAETASEPEYARLRASAPIGFLARQTPPEEAAAAALRLMQTLVEPLLDRDRPPPSRRRLKRLLTIRKRHYLQALRILHEEVRSTAKKLMTLSERHATDGGAASAKEVRQRQLEYQLLVSKHGEHLMGRCGIGAQEADAESLEARARSEL